MAALCWLELLDELRAPYLPDETPEDRRARLDAARDITTELEAELGPYGREHR